MHHRQAPSQLPAPPPAAVPPTPADNGAPRRDAADVGIVGTDGSEDVVCVQQGGLPGARGVSLAAAAAAGAASAAAVVSPCRQGRACQWAELCCAQLARRVQAPTIDITREVGCRGRRQVQRGKELVWGGGEGGSSCDRRRAYPGRLGRAAPLNMSLKAALAWPVASWARQTKRPRPPADRSWLATEAPCFSVKISCLGAFDTLGRYSRHCYGPGQELTSI